jgi:uncharacterized MAPEG superfamily protein
MPFAAAVLMAYGAGVTSALAGWAAIAFVVGRFFFSIFYLLNIPLGRSLMFIVGALSTGILMILSLQKVSG